MSYFRNVWLALRGRLSQEQFEELEEELGDLHDELRGAHQKAYDLERRTPRITDENKHLAQAAIDELNDRAKYGGEAQRKAESDKLGDAVIRDMLTQPNKFIPPEEDTE